MKHRILSKFLSWLTAMAVLLCSMAVCCTAFAAPVTNNVRNERELREAIEEGGTIYLETDIWLEKPLEIGTSKQQTSLIDLKGFSIYRTMDSAKGDGYVIKVGNQGKLEIVNTGKNKDCGIYGGWSNSGGGVLNYGEFRMNHCNVFNNKAEGNGGGIFGASGSKTDLVNVTVSGNTSNGSGGGIFVERGATYCSLLNVTVTANTAAYDGGGIESLGGIDISGNFGEESSITNNVAYGSGSGIYANYNDITVRGKVTVKDNNGSDVYLRNNTKIAAKELTEGSSVGVTFDDRQREFTTGYSEFNTDDPSTFFFANTEDGTVAFNEANTEAVATVGYTEFSVYDENNELTQSDKYLDPDDAWTAATDAATADNTVVFRLGSNWTHKGRLNVRDKKNVIFDLNGYYVDGDRDFEHKVDGGSVFLVDSGATFTVMDSRPDSKGYDGYKGGVITNGSNSMNGGGIYVGDDATLVIVGGTIANCTAGYGGGIYISDEAKLVRITNCRISNCVAWDTKAEGGGIYCGINDFIMTNSSIDGCNSDDNGGALSIDSASSDNGCGYLLLRNVNFSNNVTEDDGAAISITSFNDNDTAWKYDVDSYLEKMYALGFDDIATAVMSEQEQIQAQKMKLHSGVRRVPYMKFDQCYFAGNRTYSGNGGAVSVRDNTREVTTFSHCTFVKNVAKDNGGAISVYDDSVLLSDCVITDNQSKNEGGGVYVDSLYDINVKGRLIIKDNKSTDKSRHGNLCLQEGTASTARLYSGGLYEGSYIMVSTTDDETHFARGIAEYQQKYFHPETGEIEFVKKETKETKIISTDGNTASIFGRGSMIIIIAVAAAALAAALVAVAVKKKKGVAENGNDEDE